ncbi:MAG: hypothetical protein FJ096_20010 [Deltaproteobacteria bacterium]|nr:hypothetical protein [Deltaproteobacteria bacterium]
MRRSFVSSSLGLAFALVGCSPSNGTSSGGATSGGASSSTAGSGGSTPSGGCGKPHVATQFGDANGDGTPESETSLVVQGRERRAAVRFPTGYDPAKPHPLVFEFHGDQNQGAPLDPSSRTQGIFGANEYGDRAIVVALRGENLLAPEVRDDFAAFVSWDTLRPPVTNPDVAAVQAYRSLVAEQACVAADKVFAVGFSGGGFFAQALRCFGEEFAGIANFQSGLDLPAYPFLVDDDGKALHLDVATCDPSAVPQLVVHLEGDSTVVAQQGIDTASFWADKHGCAPLDESRSSSLEPACVEYDGCGAGEDVVLCTPAGGGHEVWSPEGAAVVTAFFGRFF